MTENIAETIKQHPSRWIAVVSVLVTLWMFIFTFVVPYVDRVTSREVRLSQIESDLKHLTNKVDLIYEHIIENKDDE